MSTETATVRQSSEVFVIRRLLTIYLPMIVIGMAAYFYSYTLTLTANGLTALALLWVIGWVGVAARDGKGRS